MKNNILQWKAKLHEIVYEADTKSGKYFDIAVLIIILFSVVLVMIESIDSIKKEFYFILNIFEWIITILFTIEYVLRIISVKKPLKYIFSFYGIIDLLSTIPKYLSFIISGTNSLIAIRALRLLRVFRILKLTSFISESNFLIKALKASKNKILIFMFSIVVTCIILGTIMYMVETNNNGFSNIPKSIYWSIVTMTTVGYGDIFPITISGQVIASIIMILGYGIIAVPTGIVSAEINYQQKNNINNTQSCQYCMEDTHYDNSKYCHECGKQLNNEF